MQSFDEFQSNLCETTIYSLIFNNAYSVYDCIAVIDSGKNTRITYKTLHRDTLNLACYLNEQDPEQTIAVLSEKGYNQALSTLAIMATGSAYLPLHSEWPEEKIIEVLNEAGTQTILISKLQYESLKLTSRLARLYKLVVIENIIETFIASDENIKNLPQTSPDDVAYVIFTSGSTGKPKGVTITHRAALNTILAVNHQFQIDQTDKVLALSELSFDLSVYDIFGLLIAGGCVVFPAQEDTKNAAMWLQLLQEHQISLWNSVPQLAVLLEEECRTQQPVNSNLKLFLLSGDKIPLELQPRLREVFPGARIVSLGGATEGSIWSIWFEIKSIPTHWASIPYGYAMPGQLMLVLNEAGDETAYNELGEIHIGGAGVAKNYWNNPQRTADSFYIHEKFGRIYKTGDLGRLNPEGYIEFCGRKDTQVKIRGYRVELGDIEAKMNQIPGVAQAVVSYNNQQLIGYYLLSESYLEHAADIESQIRNALVNTLPSYMIPTHLVCLDAIPLTANGKVDYKQLPLPQLRAGQSRLPKTKLEQKIIDLFALALGFEEHQICLEDEFVNLGGDSIDAIRITSKIRQELNYHVRVADIFETRTIGALVNKIESGLIQSKIHYMQESGILQGDLKLHPVQQWFVNTALEYPEQWSQICVIKTPLLNPEKLKKAIHQLIDFHDSFRIQYDLKKHPLNQCYDAIIDFDRQVLFEDFSEIIKHYQSLEHYFQKLQETFCFNKGLLWKIVYIHSPEDLSARIAIIAHHFIIDTVSWRILADHLEQLYHGKTLAEKITSYRQWNDGLYHYAQSQASQKTYWQETINHFKDPLASQKGKLARSITRCHLETDETHFLIYNANSVYQTEINDLLLTALAYALYDMYGQSKSRIMLEGHGREDIDNTLDVSRTTGWFTSLFPVGLEVSDSIGSTVTLIKDRLRSIPDKGVGFGAIMGYDPKYLSSICFNYLGQFDKQNEADESWSISHESIVLLTHPQEKSPYDLTITGMLFNKTLQFVIEAQLSPRAAQAFSTCFLAHARRLISHLKSQNRSFLTLSDVNHVVSHQCLQALQTQREIASLFEANSLQQGFIYHSLAEGDHDDAYHVQTCFNYQSPNLELDTLKKSWEMALHTFASLRTGFDWSEKPVQIIYKKEDLPWQFVDLSLVSDPDEQQQQINALRLADRKNPFNLNTPPLFRLLLIKCSNEKYHFIFSAHHAILDGWSNLLLINYIHTTYSQLVNNISVPEYLSSQYEMAQKYLQRHQHNNDAYWREALQMSSQNNLSTLLSIQQGKYIDIKAHKFISHPQVVEFNFAKKILSDIHNFNKRHQITTNTLLHYCTHLFLNLFAHEKITTIGMTVSGRDIPVEGIDEAVGLLINTLPVLVNHDHSNHPNTLAMLMALQAQINAINTMSATHLSRLQNDGVRLFDVLFVYNNFSGLVDLNHFENGLISDFKYYEKLDYPLVINVEENQNELKLIIHYASEIISANFIQRFIQFTQDCISQILVNPTRALTCADNIFHLPLTKTQTNPKTIHDIFLEKVAQSPHKCALVYNDQRLSYEQLNNRATELASHLQHHFSPHSESLILTVLKNPLLEVVANLAIIKMGCAYVPVDINATASYIDYLCDDIQPPFIISERHDLAEITNMNCKVSVFNLDTFEHNSPPPGSFTPVDVRPSTAACVMYTSGSTGKPKGVLIEHKNIVSLVIDSGFINISQDDVFIKLADHRFDASLFEIWGSLLNGCTLVLSDDPLVLFSDTALFAQTLSRYAVSVLWLTKSIFDNLFQRDPHLFRQLNYLIAGGEALNYQLVKTLLASESKPQHFLNGYGPTENTTFSCVAELTLEALNQLNAIPIGKAFKNRCAFILGHNLELLPQGAMGEIYVGGEGLARCYLNSPEQTREKFIDHQGLQTRLYKTGDLGFMHTNGDIYFLGRTDSQVKVRGYRIELTEIERVLLNHPKIEHAIALILENSNNHRMLVAYYQSATQIATQELNDYFLQYCPAYMLPSRIIHVQKMKLTATGKIDRQFLQNLNVKETNESGSLTDEQQQLRTLWSEVLNISADYIGLEDDFFQLGGDSILSIQLINKINKTFKINLPVRALFTWRTLFALSKNLHQNRAKKDKILDELQGDVPLLPIQKWFFDLDSSQENHWNQAFLIKVPVLDIIRLKKAINQLINHYDVFALRYEKSSGRYPRQFYAQPTELQEIERIDVTSLSSNELENVLTRQQSDFSFYEGNLFKFVYLEGYEDGSARLFIACHHLIIDAVSWRIIADDIQSLYLNQPLSPLEFSYRQWTQALAQYAIEHEGEKEYWQKILKNYRNIVPAANTNTIFSLNFILKAPQTKALLSQAKALFNASPLEIILYAFSSALSHLCGTLNIHLNLEGHGREHLGDIDLSKNMGWFTSMYPVEICIADTPAKTINAIKDNIRSIPENGVGFGALFGYDQKNLPNISLNYLGQFQNASTQLWQVSNEPVGETIKDKSWLSQGIEVIVYVHLDQIHCEINSGADRIWLEALIQQFQAQFEHLLAYCHQSQTQVLSTSDFSQIESQADIDLLPAIQETSVNAWFNMTEIQKAYLLGRLGNYEIGNICNHVYYEYFFQELDIKKLESSLNTLIIKQPVLRTVFSYETMQQRFLTLEEIKPYSIVVNTIAESDINSVRNQLSHKVYDPQQAPLFTFQVSKIETGYYLHISMDLILLDAESRRIFLILLHHLYQDPAYADKMILNNTFKTYQESFDNLKKTPWYQKDKAYWLNKVTSMPLRPELPFLKPPHEIRQPYFTDHTLTIDPQTWKAFKNKVDASKLSYSSVLLSIFGEIIALYSGSKEFLITLTLFNRYPIIDDVASIPGDFTSTNLFHFKSNGGVLFHTTRQVHQELWEDIHHALFSGVEVQRELMRVHSLDINKAVSPVIFTCVLGNKNNELDTIHFLNPTEVKDKRYWTGQTSQAWIDLQLIESNDSLDCKWLYVEELFSQALIAEMNTLMHAVIKHLALADVQENERQVVCAESMLNRLTSNEETDVPSGTLYDLIQSSDHIAVVDPVKGAISYHDLLDQTELLSKFIVHTHQNLRPVSQLIAVLAEKGLDQVLATFSIMKAGFAYLPLHVEWPLKRIAEVLEEGQVNLLFMSKKQAANRSLYTSLAQKVSILIIEDILEMTVNDPLFHRDIRKITLPEVKTTDIAYVIFTSGSTGKPKGVTISHQGAKNTLLAVNQKFGVSSNDKVLALSELSFDLSVYDIFGILIAGGTIVFPDQDKTKSPSHWLELIHQHQISIWNTVPQLASLLIDEIKIQQQDCGLRLFLLSGDKIPMQLPEEIKKCCPNTQVISLGGATEGSVWSIWYETTENDHVYNSVPYGYAMPNQKMVILNLFDQLCPENVIGEIAIGGIGVALDYWQDKEKTQASFFNHPTLGRLYRTGDLGKWMSNGAIEFIGRKDNQVKIRGYRVELAEIESRLMELDWVHEACTHYQNDRLFAWIKTELPSHQNQQYLERVKQINHRNAFMNSTCYELTQNSTLVNKIYSRKSYREFNGSSVSQADLLRLFTSFSPKETDLLPLRVSDILSGVNAFYHEGSDLPKFWYSSAGSTYSVNIYFQLNDNNDEGIPCGLYFYDRIHHQLKTIKPLEKDKSAPSYKIHLIAHNNDINPVYGQYSDMLFKLEAGYMHAALEHFSQQTFNASFDFDRFSLPIDLGSNKTWIATLTPGQSIQTKSAIDCYVHLALDISEVYKQGWYEWSEGKLSFLDWKSLPKPISISDNAATTYSSCGQIFFVSKNKVPATESYFMAGFYSQKLCEVMNNLKMGACPMGEILNEHTAILNGLFQDRAILHHLVFGSITLGQQQALNSSNSKIERYTAKLAQEYASNTLPHYMVPDEIYSLDSFPLTANGKLDRKALLSSIDTSTELNNEGLRPETPLEIEVAKIWASILKIDEMIINSKSHFFKLGGNSLLAMQLVGQIRKQFDVSYSIEQLYQHASFEAIVETLTTICRESDTITGML